MNSDDIQIGPSLAYRAACIPMQFGCAWCGATGTVSPYFGMIKGKLIEPMQDFKFKVWNGSDPNQLVPASPACCDDHARNYFLKCLALPRLRGDGKTRKQQFGISMTFAERQIAAGYKEIYCDD